MELSSWHKHIEMGNAYFHKQCWHEAEQEYHLAMVLLDDNLQAEKICCDKLAAWICVCHNLGDVYQKLSKEAEALYFFEHPHQVVSSLLSAEDEHRLASEICLKMSNLTYRALVNYQKTYPNVAKVFSTVGNEPTKPTFSNTKPTREELCQKQH